MPNLSTQHRAGSILLGMARIRTRARSRWACQGLGPGLGVGGHTMGKE